jgi:recombinational DNA repair protein RecR
MARTSNVVIMGTRTMSRDAFVAEVNNVRDEISELKGKLNAARSKLAQLKAACPHVRDQGCPCDICGDPADADD